MINVSYDPSIERGILEKIPVDISIFILLIILFFRYGFPLIQEWLHKKSSRGVIIRDDKREVSLIGDFSSKDILHSTLFFIACSRMVNFDLHLRLIIHPPQK